MDILVSSNLERLLYELAGAEETRDCMSKLAAGGKYAVGAGTLGKIQDTFSAGFCGDGETKAVIADVFREKGYLMDTHTAVAYKVLRDYREREKDDTPAIVVSTASPFKFAADVLAALGEEAGDDPLGRLSAKTGVPVPAPLSGLEGREVRFTQSVEKQEMLASVDAFI